jgi:A/G-specific adenine glycosylase
MTQPADERETQAVRQALLAFYRTHKRDLPWRKRRDAYGIWLSEIMLQQTQVDTVRPRYLAFLALFPTIEALAAADVETVCEAWAGLGYYRRARNLHRAAQVVVAEHQAQMPASLPALLALPGVGRYTAGAIASIAYNIAAPIVDGNVARVFARLYAISEPAASTAGKKLLWAYAARLVEGEHPGDLNQALMELGATVCTPRAPRCCDCPIQAHCQAWAQNRVALLPAPVVRSAPKAMAVAFAYVAQPKGVWLVRRAVSAGLWAGLWELPSADGVGAKAKLAAALGAPLGPPVGAVAHRLTHRQVTATIYRPKAQPAFVASANMRLWKDPLSAPLSTLARRAILAAQQALPS